ncbi:MAG TPA: hypothetical protein VFR14_10620 [Candidatus Limnocylindrales bacterium]|nr:hypothetical protein [Candidatus Limnocylindrales bacterium]
MARAKSTHRAEARRRYRAQLAESEGALADEDGDELAPTTSARPGTPAPPPARPSLVYAFRTSFRQANFREDIAYLPTLVVGTKAVWLPIVLSVASAVSLVAFGLNTFTILFFQYFAYILPVGALFLAGFLAPRASYVAGFLVGAAATVVLGVTLAAGVLGTELDSAELGPNILINGFVTSTIGGALVSSAAAWYKRFLRLANPNRGARRPPARGKPAPRRR